ncbi:hypothetical protein [Enterovirga rhinocerotis]|uniref:Uncharacterized protein n=1 Tax=Enterovirga rhinocerotis TaxID=1339210 RepID=A0A4R7C8S4_9HYPH|nr:hypothetical protein [Enterovirga rhinocerotis]TDR94838.1 hypothetical protein EV668_2128 [Enterovirga rhinocerotis]
MTDQEIERIANEALNALLSPYGFVRADVTSGEDDLGDPALFVRAHFVAGSPIVPGAVLGDGLAAFRARLREAGEARFPYFDVQYARARA